MARVIMGIGIPGSSKTTILKPFAERNAYTYISPDDLRAELLGDTADQSEQRMIWKEAYARTAAALGRNETVVFDATWAKVDERKAFIRFVRESGADQVCGVFAAVPLDVAKERNSIRQQAVPEKALTRMNDLLMRNPPSIADGFDSVLDITSVHTLERNA